LSKKIFIIGSAGIPARYGGFETFAENVASNLNINSTKIIACSRSLYSYSERKKNLPYSKRFFIPLKANGFISLIYDLWALIYARHYSSPGDCILILGIVPPIYIPFMPRLKKRKLIVHIDGLEWQRAKWGNAGKRFLLFAYQASLKYSHSLILDNKALTDFIPTKYQYKISLIAYGGDHLPKALDFPLPSSGNYALVIARSEPENNLELILETFVDYPSMPLVIISNYRNTAYGKRIFRKYKDLINISFIDAIYNNPALLQAYRVQCKVYIHGHSAGGTNPSLVEALYSGLPVIAWDNAFNRSATDNKALYFNSGESLISIVNALNENMLQDLRKKLSDFAKKEYRWKKVGDTLLTIINNDTDGMK
jgi:glycosyltransferase involved in cell wall biosynthesis